MLKSHETYFKNKNQLKQTIISREKILQLIKRTFGKQCFRCFKTLSSTFYAIALYFFIKNCEQFGAKK